MAVAALKYNHDYEFSANMGSSQRTINDFVILHYVGDTAGGMANAQSLRNNVNVNYTYVAFVVGDGGVIYCLGEPGFVQWGAGTYANAHAPVQIELGHAHDKATFLKDYHAYVDLARVWALHYGIPLTLDKGGAGTRGIKSHLWVTQNIWGDHADPYGYLKSWGITKSQLAHDLKHGFGGSATKVVTKKPLVMTYLHFQPKKLQVLSPINIYKTTAFNKRDIVGSYKKGDILDVIDMHTRSTKSVAFQTDKGWVSGRTDLVMSPYYTHHGFKHVTVTNKTGVNAYRDTDLKQQLAAVVKPGYYTVEDIVKRKNGLTSFKLKSGIYITTRKDSVKAS